MNEEIHILSKLETTYFGKKENEKLTIHEIGVILDYVSFLEQNNKYKNEEIERLNKKIEQYENPEDMTLMFMWCDEKAKDEIKRLNSIINEIEKELKKDYKIWMCNSRSIGRSVKFGIDVCKTHFYNRLQELKGSDKE